MLLSAEHIDKDYGTKTLFKDATLYLEEKSKIGIIGVNGTGKSTLLKILAGEETADSGDVTVARNVQISFLPQNPDIQDDCTVLEQVFLHQSAQFREINEYEVKAMLTRLGIVDDTAKIGTLSGGQKKRVALTAALIRPAEVLILDEPTNHLDSDMVLWLEERLKKFTGGLIMVTHDRYFLENVANRITELSRGKLYTYEANYSKYLELRAARYDMAEASERKRQAILRREYEWISRGARARSTKSKERIDRYQNLKAQQAPTEDASVEMTVSVSRMGKKLIQLTDVSKSFGDKCVIRDFSYGVKRDDRMGIVGKNGAGKSTLLNIIAGQLIPDTGSVEVGSTMRIGYFMQENKALPPKTRVYDFISEIASEVKTTEGVLSASQLLEKFLFDSNLQYSNIEKLSGGERRRLYLLSILAAAPNVLLLDEPTNDLDIDTLTILENYLESFPGAVVAVSHDRYFLDKVATSIFDVTGNGGVVQYAGNFSDYLEKRIPEEKETPVAAAKPAPPRVPAKTGKLKMTFNEQREFERIDADIAALESEIAACQKELDGAQSDYVRLLECTEKLEKLKKQLEEKTDRWVYLNELAETIAMQQK